MAGAEHTLEVVLVVAVPLEDDFLCFFLRGILG